MKSLTHTISEGLHDPTGWSYAAWYGAVFRHKIGNWTHYYLIRFEAEPLVWDEDNIFSLHRILKMYAHNVYYVKLRMKYRSDSKFRAPIRLMRD